MHFKPSGRENSETRQSKDTLDVPNLSIKIESLESTSRETKKKNGTSCFDRLYEDHEEARNSVWATNMTSISTDN